MQRKRWKIGRDGQSVARQQNGKTLANGLADAILARNQRWRLQDLIKLLLLLLLFIVVTVAFVVCDVVFVFVNVAVVVFVVVVV